MPIPRGQPAHRYIPLVPQPSPEEYGPRATGWVCYHCGEEKHVWRDLGRWWVGYGPEEHPHPSPCHAKRCGCGRRIAGGEGK